jgi:hypothetical protein
MAKKKPAWRSMLPGGLEPSRLTLDELRNMKKAHGFLTERVDGPPGIAEFPSVDHYENGEILLTRAIRHGDQVFLWGDPKGFPKETKTHVEDMVRRKLFYFDEEKTPAAQFEAFMKLASIGGRRRHQNRGGAEALRRVHASDRPYSARRRGGGARSPDRVLAAETASRFNAASERQGRRGPVVTKRRAVSGRSHDRPPRCR